MSPGTKSKVYTVPDFTNATSRHSGSHYLFAASVYFGIPRIPLKVNANPAVHIRVKMFQTV